MAEDHDAEDPDVSPELPTGDRRTAPQSEYTFGQVRTGLVVLVVGLVLTVGIALAL